MRINILAKNTGIGNQFQFMPHAMELARFHNVTCDSPMFCDLTGIEKMTSVKADWHIVIFGYDELKVWKARLTHSGNFIGFKYRIKGIHLGWGFDKSFKMDPTRSEVAQNDLIMESFGMRRKTYKLERTRRMRNYGIVLGPSRKTEKNPPDEFWRRLILLLEARGYSVRVIDRNISENHFIATPTISDLRDALSTARYYIGVDSGPMHLADLLNIPSIIIYGPTSSKKNGPVFSQSKVINACEGTCHNWSRYNCEHDYECLKLLRPEYVVTKLTEMIKYEQSQVI